MKKSRKLFSFLAIALSAFLLIGSVGTFKKREIAEANSGTYSRVVGADTLKAGNYIEYGEYPQSVVSVGANARIKELILRQFGYDTSVGHSTTGYVTSVEEVMAKRTANNGLGTLTSEAGENAYFRYQKETAYFIALKDIYIADDSTEDPILRKGEKVYEYISGVNALEKYPVYMYDSSIARTDTISQYRVGDDLSNSIRSSATTATLETINKGSYYRKVQTHWTGATWEEWQPCDCKYCAKVCSSVGDAPKVASDNGSGTPKLKSRTWTDYDYDSNISDSQNNYEYNDEYNSDWLRSASSDDCISASLSFNESWANSILEDGHGGFRFYKNGSGYLFRVNKGKLLYESLNGSKWQYEKVKINNNSKLSNDGFWYFDDSNTAKTYIEKIINKVATQLSLDRNNIYQIVVTRHSVSWDLSGHTQSLDVKVWATNGGCVYCSSQHHQNDEDNRFSLSGKHTITGQEITATGSSYNSSGQYYFKVEPIKWKITEKTESGKLKFQSDLILDSAYLNLYKNMGSVIEGSYLQNWLNIKNDPYTAIVSNQVSELSDFETESSEMSSVDGIFKELLYDYAFPYSPSYGGYYLGSGTLRYYISGILGKNGSYDQINAFKSNINSYKTKAASFKLSDDTKIPDYVKNLTSFKKMAFTNENIKYNGTVNFNANLTLGTTAYGKPYTDFAAATGLVTNNDGGLVWATGGVGAAQIKSFNNDGSIGNASDNVKHVNQSAGIIPTITLDPDVIENNYTIVDTSDKTGGCNTAMSFSGIGATPTLKFIKRNADSATTSEQVQVEGYKVNRNNNTVKLKFKFNAGYDYDYIRVVMTNSTEFTKNYEYTNTPKWVAGTDYVYYVLEETNDPSWTTSSVDGDGYYTGEITLAVDPSINLGDGTGELPLKILAYAITGDENEETMIRGSELRTGKYEEKYYVPGKGDFADGSNDIQKADGHYDSITKYYYEGDTITFTREKFQNDYVTEGGSTYYRYAEWYKQNGGKLGTDYTLANLESGLVPENAEDNFTEVNGIRYYASQPKSTAVVTLTRCDGTGASATRWTLDGEDTEVHGFNGYANTENPNIGVDINGNEIYSNHLVLYKLTDYTPYYVGFMRITKPDSPNSGLTEDEASERAGNVFYLEQNGLEYQLSKEGLNKLFGIPNQTMTFSINVKSSYMNSIDSIDDLIKEDSSNDSGDKEGYIFFKTVVDGITSFDTRTPNNGPSGGEWTKTSDTEWTWRNTTGYGKGEYSITVTGPEDITDINPNLVSGKRFTVSVNGIQNGEGNHKSVNGEDVYTAFYICTYDNSAEGFKTLSQITEDTHKIDIKEDSEKYQINEAFARENTLITLEEANVKEGYKTYNSIAHNSELKVDIKLKTGYDMIVNDAGMVEFPRFTFGYGSQIVDNNGYRFAESATYPSNYGNTYAGQNLRLDENGYVVNFDENDNLIYNYTKSNEDFGRELTYHSGTYFVSRSKDGAQNAEVFLPLLYLNVNDKVYNGDILYLPVLQKEGESEAQLITEERELTVADFIKGNISYVQASIDNADHLAYLYSLGKLTIVDDDTTLGINEQQEEFRNKYPNNCILDTSTDQRNTITISSKGEADKFTVVRKTFGALELHLTRNSNPDEAIRIQKNSGTETYYITAEYVGYTGDFSGNPGDDGNENSTLIFNKDDNGKINLFVNENRYGFKYTATGKYNMQGVGERDVILSLTPVADDAQSYEPWIAYVSNTIKQTGSDSLNYWKVSNGKVNSVWASIYKTFFLLDKSTQKSTQVDVTVSKGAMVFVASDGKTYFLKENAISGQYDVYSDAGQTNKVNNWIVATVRPLIVEIFRVKESNSVETLASTYNSEGKLYYAIGETVFRITVNNVVTNITMDINSDTIGEYNYPVVFKSLFENNFTAGAEPVVGNLTVTNENSMSNSVNAEGKTLRDIEESLKTTIESEDGRLKFKPYINIENNGQRVHYFMAPINMVAEEGANDNGITLGYENGNPVYRVNGHLLNKSQGDNRRYVNNDNSSEIYVFTEDVAYTFAGWKFYSKNDGGKVSTTAGGPDIEVGTLFSNLANQQLFFGNTNTEVTFAAYYEEMDLNIEVFGWNMSEEFDSNKENGFYDVIEKYYNKLVSENSGNPDKVNTDFAAAGFKLEDDGTYSIKGIKYNNPINYNTMTSNIAQVVSETLFNEKQANEYGQSKGWYIKINDAKDWLKSNYFTTLTQAELTQYGITNYVPNVDGMTYSANIFENTTLSNVVSLIAKKTNATETKIWNNQTAYKWSNDEFYLTIQENGNSFDVQLFRKFIFVGETKFDGGSYTEAEASKVTDNTVLYEVYELKKFETTITYNNGVEGEGNVELEITPALGIFGTDRLTGEENAVIAGNDFNGRVSLSDRYSEALLDEDGNDNALEFIQKLKITASTRYNLGTAALPVYNISAQASDQLVFEEVVYDENFEANIQNKLAYKYKIGDNYTYVYIFAYTQSVDNTDPENEITTTNIYGKLTVSAATGELSIFIAGLIGNVQMTTSYPFSENHYDITIEAPEFDAFGQQVVDGQGYVVSYGEYQIKIDDGEYYTLNFNGSETSISKQIGDSRIQITIAEDKKTATITVPYGMELYFKFVRNIEVFGKYYTVEGNEYAVTPMLFNGEAIETISSNFDSQDTMGSNTCIRKSGSDEYRLLSITDDCSLEWKEDISINTYTITDSQSTQYTSTFVKYITVPSEEPEGDDTIEEVAVNAVEYNSNADVRFTLSDAYSNYIPVVHLVKTIKLYNPAYVPEGGEEEYITSNNSNHYIFAAHMFNLGKGETASYKYTDEQTAITVEHVYSSQPGSVPLVVLEDYYKYSVNNVIYKVYGEVEADGAFAGYYKVTASQNGVSEEKETILGYMKYNEANNAYYFKTLGVKDNVVISLVKNLMKTANTYAINAVGETDYYTVEYKNITKSTTTLTGANHGDDMEVIVTMKDAYTHTIPTFNFLIPEVKSRLFGVDEVIRATQSGSEELMKLSSVSYVQKDGKTVLERQYTFSIGGIEFTVVQNATLDMTFGADGDATWQKFKEQAGLLDYRNNVNQLEFNNYLAAKYTIKFKANNNITITDVTGDNVETPEIVEVSYSPNQYVLAFDKKVNGEDHGPLEYTVSMTSGAEGYETYNGKKMYYFQKVTHGAKSYTNPFTSVSLPVPVGNNIDGSKDFGEATEGYTFDVSSDWTSDVNIESVGVGKNIILFAPFSEETYLVNITKPAAAPHSTYNSYGTLKYKAASGGQYLDSMPASLNYTKTKFSLLYTMNEAYDHSGVLYTIENFGKLKTNIKEMNPVSEGVYEYQSENNLTITVKYSVDGNVKKFVYSRNDVGEFAQVNITSTVDSSTLEETNSLYELVILRYIDAGKHITSSTPEAEKVNGTLDISVEFVKNSSEDVTDQDTGLNIYQIKFFKPNFSTSAAQTPTTNEKLDYSLTGTYTYTIIDCAWTETNKTYPIDDSTGYSFEIIPVIHGNNLSNQDMISFDTPVVGYEFSKWIRANSSTSVDRIDGVKANTNLYALFNETSASRITVNVNNQNTNWINNNPNVLGHLFGENNTNVVVKPATSTNGTAEEFTSSVGYTKEITVTYTLGSAFSANNQIRFVAEGATITSITFDGGVYVVTLKYVVSTNPTLKIDEILTDWQSISYNTYNVEVFDVDYSSTMDGTTWTEVVTGTENKVWYVSGGTSRPANNGDGTTNILEIGHNETINTSTYRNIVLEAKGITGFTATAWAYATVEKADVYSREALNEIIKRLMDKVNGTENIVDTSISTLLEGEDLVVEGITFDKVDLFDREETAILSDMFIFPLYERNFYEITVNEAVEGTPLRNIDESLVALHYSGSLDQEGINWQEMAVNTYRIPYGYPLLFDSSVKPNIYLNDEDSYPYIKDMVFCRSRLNHYDFQGFYIDANDLEDLNNGSTTLNYIVNSNMTLYVNYTREVYTVTVLNTSSSTDTFGTMQVPYGVTIRDAFSNDAVITRYDGGESTIGAFLNDKANPRDGFYLVRWANINGSEDEEIISENCKYYPVVSPNTYLVKIVAGEGFTSQIQEITGVGQPNADGYYTFVNNNTLSVSYYGAEGYSVEPTIGYRIYDKTGVEKTGDINGYELFEYQRALLISNDISSSGTYWTVKFLESQMNHLGLDDGDVIEIIVNQTISSYELTTFNCETLENQNRVEFTYAEGDQGRGYYRENVGAVLFSYDPKVAHGGVFRFTVRIAEAYNRSSKFVFELSAGTNKQTYSLSDVEPTVEAGYYKYDFAFNNVTQNITLTVDKLKSEILPSQFNVNFNYSLGGGLSAWHHIEAEKFIVEETEGFEGFTVYQTKKTAENLAELYTYKALLDDKYVGNYEMFRQLASSENQIQWLMPKSKIVPWELINKNNIDEYFDVVVINSYSGGFNKISYLNGGVIELTDNVNLYAILTIVQHEVAIEDTLNGEKGKFELPNPVIVDGVNKYFADQRNDANKDITSGYSFSYTMDAKYNQNTPVISVNGYDLIIIDINKVETGLIVRKSDTLSYVFTKNVNGYSYTQSSVLAAPAGSVYTVVVSDGAYQVSVGENVVAVATFDSENKDKQIFTLASVNGSLNISVNDENFTLNAYKIEFVTPDGKKIVQEVSYGNKLTDIPTVDKNFIQKVVYKVTNANGETTTYSGKELANLVITEDMTIEIEAVINLVILIPLVVGAVVIVAVIVVGIVKGSQNKGDRARSSRQNSEAFDRLNKMQQSSDANKKSDRPYNPYIGSSDKDKK